MGAAGLEKVHDLTHALCSPGPTMDPSVLLALSLLLTLSTPCSACQCKRQHPQTYFCMSDIVLLVEILGPGENTVLKRSFKINTIKILKGPHPLPLISSIYTPLRSDDCGYQGTFPEQSQLLIAGFLRAGRLNFTKCHMIYLWNLLTREQKIGFQIAYRTGCKCHVQPCLLCSLGCPEADLTDCVWKQSNCEYQSWSGNHSLSAMCIPSTTGRCEWTNVSNVYA
ncbi:metalloproteinase inhibitor 1-like [Myotis daubentonii]|uniref:metalloproteinase inhibitor 1-like n=1 Tax=Myotis daubentonii TaxID=98922 RepID=UPI0028731B33|nr:metalloproteinase inhibitor 1-like [Myotis daubentonii]